MSDAAEKVKPLIEVLERRKSVRDFLDWHEEEGYLSIIERSTVMPKELFGAILRRTLSAVDEDTLFDLLKEAGREGAEAELRNFENLPPDVSKTKLIVAIATIWRRLGWGKMIYSKFSRKTGEAIFKMVNSFEADCWGKSDRPTCSLVLGFTLGLMEWALGVPMDGEERQCVAKGDPYCEFVMWPVKKKRKKTAA